MRGPTNVDRASFAQKAMEAHVTAKEGGEWDTSVTDLLADLMHWFDVNQGDVVADFDECLNMARLHYEEERNG